MRRILSTAALLVAIIGGRAAAQQPAGSMPAMHHMTGDSMHVMKTTCPLHLTTLGLSASQQAVFDSIRAVHEAEMKPMMQQHAAATPMSEAEKAAMEARMSAAVAAVRAILNDEQRAVFDAAVAAHEAEMKAMQQSGKDDCAMCCMTCATAEALNPKKPDR